MVVLLVCFVLLPQTLIWSKTLRALARQAWLAARDLPTWALPSGLAAQLSLGQAGALESAALIGMVLLAALLAYHQFLVTIVRLRAVSAAAKRPADTLADRALRALTGSIGDPIAAVVEKEIRSLWRSPRFRLPFFLGFTFGVLAWLPILGYWRESESVHWATAHAITLVSLYSFLLLGPVLFLNRFGFDRNAAQAYFWLPLDLKRLLVAKNLAACFYALLEVILIGLVGGWFGLMSSPLAIVEAFVIGGIALLYLFAVGNFMSVRFPVPSDPDRISRGGAGHGIRSAAQFLLFPLSLSPVLAVLAIGILGGSPLAYSAGLLGAIGGGVLLYSSGLANSVHTLTNSRERFIDSLIHSEGPAATE